MSILAAARSGAGPWSTQPLIGVIGQYVTNPQFSGAHDAPTETHGAAFATIPMNYDGDELHFALTPSVRYGDTTGYSSVTSNYYHFDSSLQYVTDFDTYSLSAGWYRDASLLYAAEVADGLSERRDTSLLQANWMHVLTERLQFDVQGSVMRTLYAEDQGINGLIDFKYSSLTPSISYVIDERDTVKLLGGASRYNALDEITSSKSDNAQLAIERKLTELWTLSAAAGYTKSSNRFNLYFGPFLLETLESRQNSGTYSLTATRQTETANVTFLASRSLAPTGFAFLSRQDTLSVSGGWTPRERWTLNGYLTWQYVTDPMIDGGQVTHRFYSVSASAGYRWNEHWSIALIGSKVAQHFGANTGNPASSAVGIQISRQFDRTNQ